MTEKIAARDRFPFYILGLDPGTNNFAYSVHEVLSVRAGKVNTRIHQRGLIFSTVKDLKARGPRQEIRRFLACVDELVSKYPIGLWIAERYMIRPGAGGSTIESINIMLGALAVHLDPLPFRIIPASEWKNAVQRNASHSLVEMYTDLEATDQVKVSSPDRITVHEVDACHITEYGASLASGCVPTFHNSLKIVKLTKPKHLGSRPIGSVKKPRKIRKKK